MNHIGVHGTVTALHCNSSNHLRRISVPAAGLMRLFADAVLLRFPPLCWGLEGIRVRSTVTALHCNGSNHLRRISVPAAGLMRLFADAVLLKFPPLCWGLGRLMGYVSDRVHGDSVCCVRRRGGVRTHEQHDSIVLKSM